MMMATDELRIVLVTVHQSLRTAIDAGCWKWPTAGPCFSMKSAR